MRYVLSCSISGQGTAQCARGKSQAPTVLRLSCLRPCIVLRRLSGFLGAGKTTLLRYLLENSKEKIACIVNDVASINIDAKLVRNDRNRAKTTEQATTTKVSTIRTLGLSSAAQEHGAVRGSSYGPAYVGHATVLVLAGPGGHRRASERVCL